MNTQQPLTSLFFAALILSITIVEILLFSEEEYAVHFKLRDYERLLHPLIT